MTTILPHLGLGDQIIVSGMIRAKFPKAKFRIICRSEHVQTVMGLYHGMPNCNLVDGPSDEAAYMYWSHRRDGERIGLGQWNEHSSFDASQFVQEFARHLGVDVEESWKSFRWHSDGQTKPQAHDDITAEELEEPHIFMHEAKDRGYCIQEERYADCEGPNYKDIIVSVPDPRPHGNICSVVSEIARATSIHVIDSCFLNLIDRLTVPITAELSGRLFLHAYAKPSPNLPLLKKKWTVLK